MANADAAFPLSRDLIASCLQVSISLVGQITRIAKAELAITTSVCACVALFERTALKISAAP